MGNKKKHRVCTVPGCQNKCLAKGYCSKHYSQIREHGKILVPKVAPSICKVPGCGKKHLAKGYCSQHYDHMRKHGKIMPGRKITVGCKAPGCDKKHYGYGYCQKHYLQMKVHGKILPPRVPSVCSVPGCNNKHYGRGYCHRHYQQIKKRGKILPDRIKYTGCKISECDKKHYRNGYCRKHYKQMELHGKITKDYGVPNKIICKDKIAEIIIEDKFRTLIQKAIVDADDIEKVKSYSWSISSKYVVSSKIGRKSCTLGQLIMNSYGKNAETILHKNRNSFDYRKSNLVIGTRQQARINSKLQSNNKSGHKGIWWDEKRKKWYVFLVLNRKAYRAGRFKEKEKAIEARKRLEEIYHNHLKFFPREDNGRTE